MATLRDPKTRVIAAVLALAIFAVGAYLTFFRSRGFVETTAVIVDLEEDYDDGDVRYTPTVEYTVDGTTYTRRLDESSDSFRIDDTITVLYDPANPAVVHGNGPMGIVMMVASAVILVVVIFFGRAG